MVQLIEVKAMERRTFMALVSGGLLAAPLAAEAQPTVKTLYQLESTEPEREALREMLATC